MSSGWMGPAIAISLMVIAACYLLIGIGLVVAARAVAEREQDLRHELARLRADLAPAIDAVNRLGQKGASVADVAEAEVKEIIATSRQLRGDVQHGINRAKRRLAEFDAVIGVVQEEVEATALDVSGALSAAREGAGMISRLRRLIRPRRRGRR